VSIESTVYVQGWESVSASLAEARRASRETGSLAWVSWTEPGERDFTVITDSLGLEPPFLEEAAEFPHRSGVERHDNRLVAVLPILGDSGEKDATRGQDGLGSVEVDWVLVLAVQEPNMIVTLTDGEGGVVDKLRRKVGRRAALLARDSETVLLEIIGEAVGDYEHAAGAIDGCVRRAEVTVMEGKSRDTVRQIHLFTSQAVGLQQALMPLASALEQLVVVDATPTHRQLSRVRHRGLRVTEELDGARARLFSLLQVNLTVVGQKISAWGAILIVPSLIAGVFGMNFESAWWQKADHGFEAMLVAMLLISGSLYVWFKRSGWL
jgi:magnesium transporter